MRIVRRGLANRPELAICARPSLTASLVTCTKPPTAAPATTRCLSRIISSQAASSTVTLNFAMFAFGIELFAEFQIGRDLPRRQRHCMFGLEATSDESCDED